MTIKKTESNKPQEFAAIDLGSNSFHMVIARVVNGALQILSRLKQRVLLAEGLESNNVLNEESIARGIACLALFAERLRGFPESNVTIVGTHTLRQAVNAKAFLKLATTVIPYPIEIIAGQEESRLIFMGVAHTQPEKGRKLVVDIGGGSTELVIGEDFEPVMAESRRMGCVNFAQSFFPGGDISKKNFRRARLAASQKLKDLSLQYRIQGWEHTLGASGTIKSIHEVLVAMGKKDGLITIERLNLLVDQVLLYKSFSSLSLPGLSEERQPLFVAGLAILCGVFDSLGIDGALRLSCGALREGVLYEMERRFRHKDIRSRTAKSLADHYGIDREQAKRVLKTTELLYAQWMVQNRKLIQPQLEALLKWAAMLHEVGLSINQSGMQRHSAYILQNSSLPGFNQEQQLLLTALVRLHRKAIKLEELPHLNLFKKKHYLPLIQLLRLSILLNNQRQSTLKPESLYLLTHDNHWTLFFPFGYLSQNNLVQLSLAGEQGYWNDIVGWKLMIKEEAVTKPDRNKWFKTS